MRQGTSLHNLYELREYPRSIHSTVDLSNIHGSQPLGTTHDPRLDHRMGRIDGGDYRYGPLRRCPADSEPVPVVAVVVAGCVDDQVKAPVFNLIQNIGTAVGNPAYPLAAVLVKCFCNTCGSNFRGQHRHANASGTRAIDYVLRHPCLAVLSVPERKQSAARQPLQDSLPSGWIPRFKRRFVTIV